MHPDRLGAVEIHSKLLRKEVPEVLTPEGILNDRIIINQIYVPNADANLDILILNDMVNDFGYLLKSTNFKSCYDSLVLEQQMPPPKDNDKISKYHRVFYALRGSYFEPLAEGSKNINSSVVKTFYKHINKNGLIRRIYTGLVKLNIGLITCLEGVKLFVKNKRFRADVWNHKSEVIKLFRGEK